MKIKTKLPRHLLEEPLFISLFLFIIIVSFFIFNLNGINIKVKDYNYVTELLNKIKILDNTAEAFAKNRATFINYDEIVSKTNMTTKMINELKNEKIYKNFESKISEIDRLWMQKVENIERFKSINSAIVSVSSYVIELSKKIKKNYMENNVKDILLLDNSLINIFILFINEDELNHGFIDNSLENLKYLAKKYNNTEIDFLYKRLEHLVRYFSDLSEIRENIIAINLQEKLNSIEMGIGEIKNSDIKGQQQMAVVLFVISVVILIILFIVYNNSMRIKKELQSFIYAVENSDNSIVMTNANREITYVNEAFEKATGYTKAEALGKNPRILKSGKMPEEHYRNINEILNRGEKWVGEFININKFGEIYYETASITPILEDKKIVGYLSIKLNVTEYVRQKEKAEFLAFHDPLTKLPNRRNLEKKAIELIIDSQRDEKMFSILFIDLDGFKIINDTLGHEIGDLLLKAVGKRFKELLRDGDFIFRLGGDEFAIVLEYRDRKDIEIVSSKIIKTINNVFIIEENKIHIGCSIGISQFPKDAQDLTSLLKYSDIAMYRAKEGGKNRFEFYEDIT